MEKKKETNESSNAEDEVMDQAELELTSMENGGEAATGKQPIAELKEALETAQQNLLYARAEMDNTRKRLLREQEAAVKFANERLVRELLGIVDLFDRGMLYGDQLKEKGSDNKEISNFVSGMEMTHRELIQLLTRFGVEFIGQAGEKFDPAKHEAISQIETTEDKNGQVLQVMQRGALLNGRLLTPAKVVVGITNDGN